MKDTFDDWLNRGHGLMNLSILPYKMTENDSPLLHAIGVIVTIPWFVLTLPIQLLLCIPALFCGLMAVRHLGVRL